MENINIHFLCYSEALEIKKTCSCRPFFLCFFLDPKPTAFRKVSGKWIGMDPTPKSGTPKPWKLAVSCKPCRRCPSKYTTKAADIGRSKQWKKHGNTGSPWNLGKPWKFSRDAKRCWKKRFLLFSTTSLFNWPLRTYPQRKKQSAIL